MFSNKDNKFYWLNYKFVLVEFINIIWRLGSWGFLNKYWTKNIEIYYAKLKYVKPVRFIWATRHLTMSWCYVFLSSCRKLSSRQLCAIVLQLCHSYFKHVLAYIANSKMRVGVMCVCHRFLYVSCWVGSAELILCVRNLASEILCGIFVNR